MVVIKVGGSLARSDALTNCLEKINIKYQDKRVIIVGGGGIFADQVRIAQQQYFFDDKIAHHMAILAMQQMALLIKGLQPDWQIFSSITEIIKTVEPVMIWSPLPLELDKAGIEASWDVSSDSLAAFLAKQVGAAQLVLLKSANISPNETILDLQNQGVIDAGFHTFIESTDFTISIKHHDQF